MYSVFLSSYTNTRESLGELEKAMETLACGSCSHSISLYLTIRLRARVFYERIVNEAQPSWLSLVENEGK